ncbi:MAG TPA: helix-turn-helix transcriptional regulator [Polyangiaceae bacterium]|nr:helix-turn-helix transcriptional regulator [Polyangiaceae bacterium]
MLRNAPASASAVLVSCSVLSLEVPAERPLPRVESPRRSPSLGRLWDELLDGRRKITGYASDEEHCSLAVADGEWPQVSTSVIARQRRALSESAILGQAQKVLAFDLGRSSATVSTVLHASLQGMGLSCQFRCLPLSLALLAHAARRPDALPRPSWVRENDAWIVTFARPDWTLRARLSGGEYEVARLALEGKTHAEMALLRRVSVRTIANQLQSVFSKLKVSGRFQLLRLAIDGQTRGPYDARGD